MQTILQTIRMYATQAREIISRHHKYGWVLTVFAVVLVFGVYFRKDAINAASFTFTQSNWATGVTANTATHSSNQSGWAEYSAATNMTGGATATLAPITTTFTDAFATSSNSVVPVAGGTFSAGTLSNTSIDMVPASGMNVHLGLTASTSPFIETYASGYRGALTVDSTGQNFYYWGYTGEPYNTSTSPQPVPSGYNFSDIKKNCLLYIWEWFTSRAQVRWNALV